MSARLDWRKAHLAGRRTMSTLDEKEYRERDAAARWLERKESKRTNQKPSRQTRKQDRTQ